MVVEEHTHGNEVKEAVDVSSIDMLSSCAVVSLAAPRLKPVEVIIPHGTGS